jgi:hypothetical protein
MITLFLGAGLSSLAGVPLASELFSEEPIVDRVSRANLVSRVLHSWNSWHEKTGGSPEEYIAYLDSNQAPGLRDTVWYVALLITLRVATVRYVGGQPQITRHHITLTSGVPQIEAFWTTVFRRTSDIAVVTTNYDIIAERAIRNQPRPRVPRPGFNYGSGTVKLEGRGYPTFAHIRPNYANGTVPLLKLHGSISWSVEAGSIVPYVDCRPAIRGNAAIVAPAKEKVIPDYLSSTWDIAADVLRDSTRWLVVGYSLPEYDLQVRELLASCADHSPRIHIFDPWPLAAERFETFLPKLDIHRHPGIPGGLDDLEHILE